MGGIVAGLGYIIAKIVAFASWIGDLAKGVFLAAWDFARDAVCWAFEGFLSISVATLSAFDFSGLTSWAGTWAGLPASVLEVIAAIGLGTAFGIIATAIGIRVLLQLVPFTRLGS